MNSPEDWLGERVVFPTHRDSYDGIGIVESLGDGYRLEVREDDLHGKGRIWLVNWMFLRPAPTTPAPTTPTLETS